MANLSDRVISGTVPIKDLTKRTKVIPLTDSEVVAGTNLSAVSVKGGHIICYTDSDDNWKAEGTIAMTATFASNTTFNFQINGLKTKSTTNYYQKFNAAVDHATFDRRAEYVNPNSSPANFRFSTRTTFSGTATYLLVDFDIELDEEPTAFTNGNMENAITIDGYIPEASSTESGIVKAGGDIHSEYVVSTPTNIGTTRTELLDYTVLNSGKYQITANCSFSNSQNNTTYMRFFELDLDIESSTIMKAFETLGASEATGIEFAHASINVVVDLVQGDEVEVFASCATDSVGTAYVYSLSIVPMPVVG